MKFETIPFEACDPLLDWIALTEAMRAGHQMPRAEIGDTFLYRDTDTLLSRAAWVDGMGVAVKSAMVLPGNPERGASRLNGAVTLLSETTAELEAVIDFRLVTKWKTAGDSLLGALTLARPDSRNILIVGAGTVAGTLIQAYSAGFPDARFTVWNRTPAGAEKLAAAYPGIAVAADLAEAVASADIIACGTMTTDPILQGDWLRPGQHVDLIGAYRADMREVDDTALTRSRIFVDSFATTVDHIGELKIPLAQGTISRDDVLADFYDLGTPTFARQSDEEITLFKNGGGAHLDLMTARYILERWQSR